MKSDTKKHNFPRTGWFALHKSVLLMTGVDFEIELSKEELEDFSHQIQNHYLPLMTPIIKAVDFHLDSSFYDTETVATEIWGRIQVLRRKLVHPSSAFDRSSLSGFASNFNDWAETKSGEKVPHISLSSPLDASLIGWDLIKGSVKGRKLIIEYLFWGLGILGWVSVIYSELRMCRCCFRWSVPRSYFCFMHTQSASDEIGRSEAFMRYRAGKVLLKRANSKGVPIRYDHRIVDHMFRYSVLAEHLFFNIPSKIDGIEIRQILRGLPRVLKLIGGEGVLTSSNKLLFNLVREKINPMELFPSALMLNVVLAENILILEEGQRPGRPASSSSIELEKMKNRASLLFENGASIAEVSKQLKVSYSRVWNWTRRHADVKSAFARKE